MVRNEMRPRSSLSLLLLFGSAAFAGPLPPAGGGPNVPIQVEVYKDGQPVSGLSAEEFVVRDKGKPVPVIGLLEVDLAAGGDNLPEEAYRQILMLFDLEFSDPLFVVQATDIARELISPELLANTRVLIAVHEPGTGLRIEVDFTARSEPLLEMLDILHDEHRSRLGSSGPSAEPVITSLSRRSNAIGNVPGSSRIVVSC